VKLDQWSSKQPAEMQGVLPLPFRCVFHREVNVGESGNVFKSRLDEYDASCAFRL
jgi:hypothetical protein